MQCCVCHRYGHNDPACTVKPGGRPGADNGGIRALSDIKDRCRVESESGCWTWAGATASGKRGTVLPVAWFAPDRRVVSVPRLAWALSGKEPTPMNWRTCCNDLCCNPKHLAGGTRAEWGLWVKAQGKHRGDPVRTATNVRIRRERSEVMSAELAAWVRESEQIGLEVAHAVGISPTSVSRIRKLQQWAPDMRASSVWGMAANLGQIRRAA